MPHCLLYVFAVPEVLGGAILLSFAEYLLVVPVDAVDAVDNREPTTTSTAKYNEGAYERIGKRMHGGSNPGKKAPLYHILAVISLPLLK